MRKVVFSVVLAVLASMGFAAWIHWHAVREISQSTSRFEKLYRRESAVSSMALSLEKYRRLSSNFRKLSNSDVAQAKNDLRESFREGVTKLSTEETTPEETSKAQGAQEQLLNLLKLSDKLEPNLFSRDAYFRPEIREIHDGIMGTLAGLQKSTEARIAAMREDTSSTQDRSFRLIVFAGFLVTGLVAFLLFREYVTFYRPLTQLHRYANEIQASGAAARNTTFTWLYGDIQSAMNRMASAVENFSKERHKFIQDVVADLKAPLTMLQSGKSLLSGGTEHLSEAQQVQAADSVRRGLAILSGSLEDLSDVENINRLDTLLHEKVVDLSELVSDVTRTLAGNTPGRQIQVSVPPMPVWALVDTRRIERVLIQSITKVSNTVPESGKVQVSISQGDASAALGIEISVQEAGKPKNGRASSGPEIDILRHWISEGGLSMMLTYKIMKALGGNAMASGVPGTSARIALRLPQERTVNRGLITAPISSGSKPAQPLMTPSL